MKITTATPKTQALMARPAWKALAEHYRKIRNVHLRSLFADDPRRGELGKVLAKRIIPELENVEDPQLQHDSSTNTLIRRHRRLKRWPS